MKTKILLAGCMLAAMIPAYAQNRSLKRGICWDEKTQVFSDAPVDKMLPGVTWIYTLGESPRAVWPA